MKTTEQILKEYTKETDIVNKINEGSFEVVRENKSYFLKINMIIAAGQIQRLHNRNLVETNLPNLKEQEVSNKKENKLADLKEKMEVAKRKGQGQLYNFYKKQYLKAL